MSWVTGAVSCFAQLLVVRGIMGAAEGSYLAPATATLSELAGDKRRGWIVGLHQSAYPLWGGLFAAIYVRQVVTTLDWRWVFYLTLIPGLVLAVVHWRFIKEPPSVVQRSQVPHSEKLSWTEPFRNRNIVLTTIIMLLFMAWTNVFIAFGTIYLTQARQLTLGLAVTIVSAWGIGAFLGMPVLSAISDRVGRRPTLVIGCLGAGVFTILYATAGGLAQA
ncbi:MFS transporter [Alicyclobacillus fastidiosus]|uniref:MFS transporter n=1 Tax=Alicyclobacillus fastidiosus TaxID=392011 RepID=UPI0024E092CC|nr:MFS transporter [Alicyclobacillus fastidiosus]